MRRKLVRFCNFVCLFMSITISFNFILYLSRRADAEETETDFLLLEAKYHVLSFVSNFSQLESAMVMLSSVIIGTDKTVYLHLALKGSVSQDASIILESISSQFTHFSFHIYVLDSDANMAHMLQHEPLFLIDFLPNFVKTVFYIDNNSILTQSVDHISKKLKLFEVIFPKCQIWEIHNSNTNFNLLRTFHHIGLLQKSHPQLRTLSALLQAKPSYALVLPCYFNYRQNYCGSNACIPPPYEHIEVITNSPSSKPFKMVFYFISSVRDSNGKPFQLYMGKDKFENEDLIKYGWPEDVWFHVSQLSSAHVYVRAPGVFDNLPAQLVEECCQLVKQNSIEGCKKDELSIVYTPWSNLKKTADMVVGQISFHDNKLVTTIQHVKKDRELLRRVEKTKTEGTMDEFIQAREARNKAEQLKEKKLKQQQAIEMKQEIERQKEMKDLRNYVSLNNPDKMSSNKDTGYDSDDFM